MIVLALTLVSAVMAGAQQAPVILRFNSDPFKKALHGRESLILMAFQDFPIYSNSENFKDLKMSFSPKKGSADDFDSDLSNLMLRGRGHTSSGKHFSF